MRPTIEIPAHGDPPHRVVAEFNAMADTRALPCRVHPLALLRR